MLYVRKTPSRCMLPLALCVAISLSHAGHSVQAPAQDRIAPAQQPASWPQFLGPQRNGVSTEVGLLDDWPADGPKEVWRVDGGVGMSGLAVSDGRLITMLQDDRAQYAAAFRADNGKLLWRTAVAEAYRNRMGNGPRATPTLAEGKAFVFTGEGVLAALDPKDGKLIWKNDVVKQLGGKPADYGMSCSPLVVGERVVVMVGAPSATAACYNISTGELVWKSGSDPCGYASPTLVTAAGSKQIVMFTGNSLLGIEPGDGGVLWRYPFVTEYRCNTASPISVEGDLLISAGESHGSVLLAVAEKQGKFQVAERWKQLGVKSTLRSEWQTPVLVGDYLYGMDNVGSAGQITHLTCIRAKTGERIWSQRRFGKGNLIAADGKLFISTMKGELVVARATPKEYQEMGRKVVIGETRQAPALAGGLLYLRDDKSIVCLDVREPQ